MEIVTCLKVFQLREEQGLTSDIALPVPESLNLEQL